MAIDTPIACTLSASEMPDRLAEIRAIGRSSLVSTEASAPRAVLRFRADDETRERLTAVVAAESECCSFLTFELVKEPGDLVLTISAPAGGEPVMHQLLAAFRAEGPVAA